MLAFLQSLFDTSGFVPRWDCGSWTPFHGWLHILSDFAIGAAYVAIPCLLAYFVIRRRDTVFPKIFWLFIAFILACGAGHLIEGTIFWTPVYRLSGAMKLTTAVVSWATVVALVWVLPQALSLPGIARLNEQLQCEIAERKRKEAERDQFFAMSPDLVCFLDAEGHVRRANAALERMLGYSATELNGRPIVDLVDSEDRSRTLAWLRSTAAGKTKSEIEIRARHAAGREVWLECAAAPSAEKDLVFAIARDITTRRKEAEERATLEAQMRHMQKLESLGVLAGGIAHDFNNLLTGILGHASLAAEETSPGSPIREHLRHIENSSKRAADLCKQLLAYSGKGRFTVMPVNLSELVDEMTGLLSVSISKSATLRCETPRDIPAVEADPTQMRQVLMNLITNASDAIGDKRGSITIKVGQMHADAGYLREMYLNDNLPEGRYVSIEVSDTGCGMDQETRERMFDPFFTTKQFGRGLGMAAVLGIVRGHRGAIRCYSEPGVGTTFRLLFPASSAPATPLSRPQPVSRDYRGSGVVLVVDDEDPVRLLASVVLKAAGFDVLVAQSGEEGVKLFEQHRDQIRAVLLDMTMPGMSGEETFRALRRIDAKVKVVLSSGYNEQDATRHFSGKGLAGFLQKPYTAAQLTAAIRRSLGE